MSASLYRDFEREVIRRFPRKTQLNWSGTKRFLLEVGLIAATNRDIQRDVKEGRFREDLYRRIKALTVRLPPLARVIRRSRGSCGPYGPCGNCPGC